MRMAESTVPCPFRRLASIEETTSHPPRLQFPPLRQQLLRIRVWRKRTQLALLASEQALHGHTTSVERSLYTLLFDCCFKRESLLPWKPMSFDQVPFGAAADFADNPEPRCPCLLILDTSGSMSGPPIAELNAGTRTFKDELSADSMASKRVEVAIVGFGPVR